MLFRSRSSGSGSVGQRPALRSIAVLRHRSSGLEKSRSFPEKHSSGLKS